MYSILFQPQILLCTEIMGEKLYDKKYNMHIIIIIYTIKFKFRFFEL